MKTLNACRKWLGSHPDLVIFSGFSLIMLALLPPGNASSDGASMLAVGTAVATDGSFAVPCEVGIQGRGGECFSTYYPLLSILAAPLIGLGRGAATYFGVSPEYVGEFAAQCVPALAAAGAATFTVGFARRLGATERKAILAGFTLLFATEIAIYSRTFFAESLATFCACLAVWGFLQDRGWKRLGGPVGICLLILAKPQLILVGLVIGGCFALKERHWGPAIATAAGTSVGSALYAGYNLLRFGDITNLGGESRSIRTEALGIGDVGEALSVLIVSPGRGFLLYSPIAILGLYACWTRRAHVLAVLGLLIPLAILALHVTNPGGGSNWGARYLAPALPLLVAGAWSLKGKAFRVAPVVAILGLAIALPTYAGFYQRHYHVQADAGRSGADLYWSVDDSPMVGVWASARNQIRDARNTDVKGIVNGESHPDTGAAAADQRFFTVVAQWWWMLPALGLPALLGAGASLVLMLCGMLLVLRAATRGRRRRAPIDTHLRATSAPAVA